MGCASSAPPQLLPVHERGGVPGERVLQSECRRHANEIHMFMGPLMSVSLLLFQPNTQMLAGWQCQRQPSLEYGARSTRNTVLH